MAMTQRRALLLGHFSTVGDLEVLNVVRQQLDHAAFIYDVAPYSRGIMAANKGWIDPREADPLAYTHLLVICGPVYRAYLVRQGIDLELFRHCTRIAVNVTLVDPAAEWNPFDYVLGRDSDQWAKCDISFLHKTDHVPVVGLCFVKEQKEYGNRQRHDRAQALLRDAARRAGMATMELDTEWPGQLNSTGITSPGEFESICARLDLILTTRLHGLVLALKNGVPVVAVDGIAGGDKVSRQAGAIGWPEVFKVEDVTEDEIDAALVRCLTPERRNLAKACARRARSLAASFPAELLQALDGKLDNKLNITAGEAKTSAINVISVFFPFLQSFRRSKE